MNTMTRILSLVVAIVLGVSTVSAQAKTQSNDAKGSVTIAGTWNMNVEGQQNTITLTLKQQGKKVTGTFANPQRGVVPLDGEFADGKLTFSVTLGGGHGGGRQLSFRGEMKKDGTLAGKVSSSRGDMTWTARRAKDK